MIYVAVQHNQIIETSSQDARVFVALQQKLRWTHQLFAIYKAMSTEKCSTLKVQQI